MAAAHFAHFKEEEIDKIREDTILDKSCCNTNPLPRIQCCHMKSQFNIDLGGGVLQHFCPRLSEA